MNVTEFLNLSKKNMIESYSNLDVSTLNNGDITNIYLKSKNRQVVDFILQKRPELINDISLPNILLRCLIDESENSLLRTYRNYIDLTLSIPQDRTILGYLIKKSEFNLSSEILSYNPQAINVSGENGIYPVEYLADKGASHMLNNYAKYIDLTLPASNNMNLAGYLIHKELSNSFKEIISHHPEHINVPGKDGIYPVEYLANKGYSSTLSSFSRYIDLTLPASNDRNLLGHLIKKESHNALKDILSYHPQHINVPGKNGVYPVEYLADKGYSNLLSSLAQYIDLTLPASNDRNLLGYLTQKEIANALKDILSYHPEHINVPGKDGVYPVEHLANKGYGTLLSSLNKYIDLTLPSSNKKTLAGYLTQKELYGALKDILSYHPQHINFIGENNIHNVEYLLDKGYSSLIKEFSKYIDPTYCLSNGKTIKDILKNKLYFDMSSSGPASQKASISANEKIKKIDEKDEKDDYYHNYEKESYKEEEIKEVSIVSEIPENELTTKEQLKKKIRARI